MQTNALIGLAALILVVGAGAWYLSTKSGEMMPAPMQTQETAQSSGTFADLITRAGSWECKIQVTAAEAPSEGVAYIADGKIRADFIARPEAMGGQEVAAHMIQADGYVYTWSDMVPQGMKMLIPEGQVTAESPAGTLGANTDVQYECLPWGADATVFVPPSTITFMEFSAGAGMVPQPN